MRHGLRVKVAPGIRVGLTSRGIRTSIGPRGAGLHVGAGPATVSSTIGAITVLSRLSNKRSARRYVRNVPQRQLPNNVPLQRPPNLELLQRQAAAAQRAEKVEEVRALEHSLVSAHTGDFPPAQPPIAPEKPPPSLQSFVDSRRAEALRGIPYFALSRRKAANQAALDAANGDWQQAVTHAQQDRDWVQKQLDQLWQARLDHDPDVVHDVLEDAFADHQMHATVLDVGVDHDVEAGVRYATVAIFFGTWELVPVSRPDLTPTGRPTLHKRTKTERNAFYLKALGSTVLATVREGFASPPALTSSASWSYDGTRMQLSPTATSSGSMAPSFHAHGSKVCVGMTSIPRKLCHWRRTHLSNFAVPRETSAHCR